MRLLYRTPETGNLAVTSVTNTIYAADDHMLIFFGDDDICIQTDSKNADKLVRSLYMEGRLDITAYEAGRCEVDLDDDDDDEDDDDDNVFTIGDSSFFLDN